MTPDVKTSNPIGVTCPLCQTSLGEGELECPKCKNDLSSLVILESLPAMHYNEGLAFAREGKFNEAVEKLLLAISFDPNLVDALMVLGKLYAQKQNYGEATGYWNRVLEIDPNHEKARAAIKKAEELALQERRSRALRSWTLRLIPVMTLIAAGIIVSLIYFNRPVSQPALAQVPTTVQPSPTIQPSATPQPTATPDLIGKIAGSFVDKPQLAALDLTFSQKDLVIYGSGTVSSFEIKQLLEETINSIDDIGAVDLSGIRVEPLQLAQVVQEKLGENEQLAGSTITVNQAGNAIYLSGSVDSVEAKALAEEIAGLVEGVELVDARELLVVPPLLVGSVQDALSADPRTTCLNIEIEQSGYNIALSGQVPSLQARLAIEAIVGEVPGIQMIDTGELVVAPPYSEYIVEQGDSLESIAQKFYQDASLWHLLYEANKNRILIPLQAGDILIIPPADAELGGLPYIDCQTRLGQ